jgi:small-conductance mechanosensitive channel
MQTWLTRTTLLGNPTLLWIVAGTCAVFGYFLVYGIVRMLAARLQKLADHRPNTFTKIAAAVARATRGWLLFLLSVCIAAGLLDFGPSVAQRLGQILYALIGLQLAFWLTRLIVIWLELVTRRHGEPDNPVIFGIVSWTIQLFIWTIVLLAVLDNAGVNVNAFVASLGVGGVAVALAAQTVLGDLLSSISIGLDKPFEVGEFIAFGSNLGTIKRVGIKSTRIDSLSGEELAISNSDLLKQLVHNYSRMRERRVVFGFSVSLGTSRAQVEKIVERVRALIGNMEDVRLDRGHFAAIGDYSLTFEFVYYVLSPSYNVYMDKQQHINLCIMDILDEMNVALAVPVRALRAASEPGRS